MDWTDRIKHAFTSASEDNSVNRRIGKRLEETIGEMSTASISRLLERDLASGGKLLKPGEKLIAQLTRHWFPKTSDLAGETHIVPVDKWRTTLAQYADKFGYPQSNPEIAGRALSSPKPGIILAKGLTENPSKGAMAGLMETLRHEGEHIQDFPNISHLGKLEGRAYPAGWKAYEKARELLQMNNRGKYQIPEKYIGHLTDEGLDALLENATYFADQSLIAKLTKLKGDRLKSAGAVTYDNLGRIVKR